MKYLVWAILVLFFMQYASVRADSREAAYTGLTQPSKEVMIGFLQPGRVKQVLVKEGQRVKEKQELIHLDDSVDRVMLKQLEMRAANNTRIEAAQAELNQKMVDLNRVEMLRKRGVATVTELEHAKLNRTVASLSVDLAKFEQKQAELKHEELKTQLEQMVLVSPINGVVEAIAVDKGEPVDRLEKVVHIVEIDPLWISVRIPLAEAQKIPLGRKVDVRFPGLGHKQIQGKVVHKPAVGDSASGTLELRIEVANPDDRPAGQEVWVSIPDLKPSAPARNVPVKAQEDTQMENEKEQGSLTEDRDESDTPGLSEMRQAQPCVQGKVRAIDESSSASS
jgi:RND family efflux transporter MFP subunit